MTITTHLYLLDHTSTSLQDDTAPNMDHKADNKPVPSHNGTHSRLLDEVENKPFLLPPDDADRTNDGTHSGS